MSIKHFQEFILTYKKPLSFHLKILKVFFFREIETIKIVPTTAIFNKNRIFNVAKCIGKEFKFVVQNLMSKKTRFARVNV